MRHHGTVFCAALLLAAGPASALVGTLEFGITFAQHDLPSVRECSLWVDTPASIYDVLDRAMDHGCITSWLYVSGVLVCIDDVCSRAGWTPRLNETEVRGGYPWTPRFHPDDRVEFVFADVGP